MTFLIKIKKAFQTLLPSGLPFFISSFFTFIGCLKLTKFLPPTLFCFFIICIHKRHGILMEKEKRILTMLEIKYLILKILYKNQFLY